MRVFAYLGLVGLILMIFDCGKVDEQSAKEEIEPPAEFEQPEEAAIDEEGIEELDEEDMQRYGSGAGDVEPSISDIKDEMIDDIFKNMKWGNIVFNVPDSMKLYETRGIHLVLSAAKTVEQIEKKIQEQGDLRNRRIRISRIMVANLKGSGFEINSITESLQVVDMSEDTEWRWEVTSRQPGMRNLYLTMDAIVTIEGQDRPHTIHSLSEVIIVHVSLQQRISGFVANNWQWLWSAILVPFIGWLWERRKKKAAN